jgi:superfamily II DNA or RNA helicase
MGRVPIGFQIDCQPSETQASALDPGRRLCRCQPFATLQAVARRGDISGLIAGYGLMIVDECHHLPARSFELAVRHAPTRRWLGLTATPYRRDGLEAIITMQCGPVRHEIALADTASAALARRLVIHNTSSSAGLGGITAIQDVFRALVEDRLPSQAHR